jgi:hypothetical protein
VKGEREVPRDTYYDDLMAKLHEDDVEVPEHEHVCSASCIDNSERFTYADEDSAGALFEDMVDSYIEATEEHDDFLAI